MYSQLKVIKTESDADEIAKAIKNYLDSVEYDKKNKITISQVSDKWGQIITTIIIQ